MKTSLEQINVSDKHFHKSKRNNLRIEEALTVAKTMEKVRAINEKQNKKRLQNVTDYVYNANILSKQQKVLQCRKCKAQFYGSMC